MLSRPTGRGRGTSDSPRRYRLLTPLEPRPAPPELHAILIRRPPVDRRVILEELRRRVHALRARPAVAIRMRGAQVAPVVGVVEIPRLARLDELAAACTPQRPSRNRRRELDPQTLMARPILRPPARRPGQLPKPLTTRRGVEHVLTILRHERAPAALTNSFTHQTTNRLELRGGRRQSAGCFGARCSPSPPPLGLTMRFSAPAGNSSRSSRAIPRGSTFCSRAPRTPRRSAPGPTRLHRITSPAVAPLFVHVTTG